MYDTQKIIAESTSSVETRCGTVYCRYNSSEPDNKNVYCIKDVEVVWRVDVDDKLIDFDMGFSAVRLADEDTIKANAFGGGLYAIDVDTGKAEQIGYTK